MTTSNKSDSLQPPKGGGFSPTLQMNDVIPSNIDLDQLKDINDKLCKEILKLAMDTAQNDLNHYDGKEPISEVAKTRIVVEYLQAAILDEITMLSEWTTRMSKLNMQSAVDKDKAQEKEREDASIGGYEAMYGEPESTAR